MELCLEMSAHDAFPMWAKFRPVFGLGGIVRRKSDGAYFEASNPGYISKMHGYYFRRVVRWGLFWKRTGEVWDTCDDRAFDLVRRAVG